MSMTRRVLCACPWCKVGETALHTAGIKGDPDVVKALLDAGADANARTHGEAVQVDPINPC